MTSISNRTLNLGTETAFIVLAEVNKRIRQGKKIISFCIGQPDFDTPGNIKKAAIKAIKEGKTGYTDAPGIMKVREAIAKYFSETRKIKVEPEDCVMANGAKPFIGYTVLAVTDYGKKEEVIYPLPGYPIYESVAIANGAKAVPLPLIEEKNFSFDIEDLKKIVNKNTKLLILNSPHNPTGGILSEDDLKAIKDLSQDYDFWIYSDEIYCKLVYDGEFKSIASLPDMYERTIISDGCSKTYAMTGWRIGFVANKKLAPYFSQWMVNTDSCPVHFNQYATIEALTGPQDKANEMYNSFKERRNLIVRLLNDIEGVKCLSPGGAFYVFPNVTEACKKLNLKNAEELRKLLLDKGVAVLADIHFGKKSKNEKNEYLRLSYATSKENIKKGVEIIKNVVEG